MERENTVEQLAEHVRGRIRRLETQLRTITNIPAVDPFEDGTVLRIVRTLVDVDDVPRAPTTLLGRDGAPRMFTYAAVRGHGLWSVTGERFRYPVHWETLVNWLCDGKGVPVRVVAQADDPGAPAVL